MVAQGVVDRMPVNLCSGTALGKRILDDFGENGIGTIGYEKNLVGKIMASTQPFEPRHRIIQDNLAVFRPDTESRSRLKIDEQRAIFGTQERDWKTLASYFGWPVTGSTDIRVV
jgi:hypothetical protein